MKCTLVFTCLFCCALALAAPRIGADTAAVAAARLSTLTQGEWDGVTASAHLETPYEDPAQSKVLFGIISYYMQPWRSYMDTWPAQQYAGSEGANWNIDGKYADAMGQLLKETGIRTLRIEIGWGNLDWNDQLPDYCKQRMKPVFDMCRKYGIRPMILLNAHHGGPCPTRDVPVTLVTDARAGDTVLHLTPGTRVHEGYTGPRDSRYIAAFPLIVKMDPDGTAHLSAALLDAFKAGPLSLVELKYQPFQGETLPNGMLVPACLQTFQGWLNYVETIAAFTQDSLGTAGKPDAGFDMEVWNEQTFGANFLNIDNYYDVKPQYKAQDKSGSVFLYQKSRLPLPTYRPDAITQFHASNCYAILSMTIDYMTDHARQYPNVKVVSGFANQWPWDSGSGLWPNQAGFSRHYYTGGWQQISPTHAPNLNSNGLETGVIDALGQFDGTHDNKDWHTVIPGTVFIPTFTMGYPEQTHNGFKTESLSRDVLPDSRYVYFQGHGRYTHNGDYRTAELWQTEVNYDRSQLFNDIIFKDGAIKRDDPRALALDEHLAAKYMLRQYLFHNAKGLKRIYLFALGADPYTFGMFPTRFYAALDASNGVLTPAVRAMIPEGYGGLAWLMKQMDGAEQLAAPRPLKVADVVEYKPRLIWRGDGTPAHPNRWNRDWFTFLPYQLAADRYLVPYYVQTIDQSHVWDKSKGLLDPARWDMPAQEYDVTIANVRGTGATVSVIDPITLKQVPVSLVHATSDSLTVHLSAVDYPRFLTITEAAPGPLIVDPRVELTPDNHVRVSWSTNIPAGASITYGADWQNRSAHQAELKDGTTSYIIPEVIKGVVAVRIQITAHGLSDQWPRWDEDPQGQIVTPGGSATQAAPATPAPDNTHPAAAPTLVPLISLLHGATPALPATYVDIISGWSVKLPANAAPTVNGATVEVALATTSGTVTVRLRYLPGGADGMAKQLPTTAPGDEQTPALVTLTNGVAGAFYDYTLTPAAHPGITNLRQAYLLLQAGQGGKDLFVLSATGTAGAMEACRGTLLAIAASVKLAG